MRTKESTKKKNENLSRWDKNPNVLNKNSLLIIRCRARLGSALYWALIEWWDLSAITALSNLKVKQILRIFASHIWPRCAPLKKYLNFFDSRRSEWERGGMEKIWEERGMREKHTGWKNRNKTSESAGCQGHPNVRAAYLSGDNAGADCVREWKTGSETEKNKTTDSEL